MNNSMKFLVADKDGGKRLDIFLSIKIKHLTRSNIKKLINSSAVEINEKTINLSSKKVKINDSIFIRFENKSSGKLLAKNINLDIYFEDKDILILNKPKGMVVHPGANNYKNTLANALKLFLAVLSAVFLYSSCSAGVSQTVHSPVDLFITIQPPNFFF